MTIAADRPTMFGSKPEATLLPWRWAEQRLVEARNYWIATARANGVAHTRPVWGVWHDEAFFFSTGSLAAGNLDRRPQLTVHLESGNEVVIVEGTAAKVVDASTTTAVIDAYNEKYEWDLAPDSPELADGLWRVQPGVVFGWLSDPSGLDHGSLFHGSATRWRFD
jgi:hypothetical protein